MAVFATGVLASIAGAEPPRAPATPPPERGETQARIAELDRGFIAHLNDFGQEQAVAVASVRQAWKEIYERNGGENFVPDALAVLYPDYRAGLEAFDAGNAAGVVKAMQPLLTHPDPFVAANARYFHIRGLIDLERFEEVETALASWPDDLDSLVKHTPFAPHLGLIRGYCEDRNLRYEAASKTLSLVASRFPNAPEPVEFGVRQLLLEIERRERGNLREVSEMMTYVADRLRAADTGKRVRSTQDEVLARLDKLIQDTEQKEQQQRSASRAESGGAQGAQPQGQEQPKDGKNESDAPNGAGGIGDLHGAPKAAPGESWGKLPANERERVLQAIRERFPSRYRQIVEQYYRSLAEEK